MDKRVRRAVKFYTTRFTTDQHEQMDKAEIKMLIQLINTNPTGERPKKKLKKFKYMLSINNINKLNSSDVNTLRNMINSMTL